LGEVGGCPVQAALGPGLEPLRAVVRQVVRSVGRRVGGQEQRQADDRPHPASEPHGQDRGRDRHAIRPRHRPDAGTGTEKFAPALLDVQDLADKLAKKYGGWTPLARNFSEVKGRFMSIPDYFIDFPGLYRKDLWTEIGMPNGPDTWDEVRVGGAKLKA